MIKKRSYQKLSESQSVLLSGVEALFIERKRFDSAQYYTTVDF